MLVLLTTKRLGMAHCQEGVTCYAKLQAISEHKETAWKPPPNRPGRTAEIEQAKYLNPRRAQVRPKDLFATAYKTYNSQNANETETQLNIARLLCLALRRFIPCTSVQHATDSSLAHFLFQHAETH
jgi:hypothetical protein